MRILYSVLFVVFIGSSSIFAQLADEQIKIQNRKNAEENYDKPYVILISADGFRHDYFELFKPKFLTKMRKKGVSTDWMIPSYPSITFPNHYTLVTGMVPAHHGLIGNSVYNRETKERYSMSNPKAVTNPDWYGGIPIWSLAESQGILSACFYWPGSEAEIMGFLPSYYYPYSENISIDERVQVVVDWLTLPESERPHLITFYMPEIDQAGHKFSSETFETETATLYVDEAIRRLVTAVNKTKLPVNFIFLSDHGMISVNQTPIEIPEFDKDLVETSVAGVYVNLFVTDSTRIHEVYEQAKATESEKYKVYLKENVPAKYQFGADDDWENRIGDVVLLAEAPYYFTLKNRRPPRASHGYHPEDTPEMNTIFMAWGADIQKRKNIAPFQNVHIYPLIAEILGLKYDHKIDGDGRLIPQVLKKK